MWPVGAAEAESRAEVVGKVSLLLDSGKKSLVDGLLVGNTVLGGLLLLDVCQYWRAVQGVQSTHLGGLALLEESFLALLLGDLVLGEVTSLAGLLEDAVVNTGDVHGGRGRNNVAGVHPSEGDAVDFEGTGDEEDTLLKVLEDDDTLAAETASEEDDDGSGLEGRANLGRAGGLAGLEELLELSLEDTSH